MAHYSKVTVVAPARLHMGFFDLSASLGRHFGSIGVALNEISTRLSLTQADASIVVGPSANRAKQCLTLLCQALGVSEQLHVEVETAIPEHVGLGSGTQMSLAIGTALSALYGLGLSPRDLAAITERGLRSGIGIGIFERGGLVVDGGRGEHTITPPLLVQMSVPDAWRFILVFDRRGQGLHGAQETQAFGTLPPFPQHAAARLCHLLLMQGLPALAEQELAPFGEVISQLQQAVGGHFAAAQGGVFTSPEVAMAMDFLASKGAVAIGQTSWGPTGFCAVASQAQAETLVQQLRSHIRQQGTVETLDFIIASARNRGAEIISIEGNC